MSNSLDPNQAQHFVGPDLDPNCFQRLSAVLANPKLPLSEERVCVNFVKDLASESS